MSIVRNDFYSGEKISEEKLDIIDENFMSLQADVDSNKASITAMINKVDDVNNPLTVNLSLDKTVAEKGSKVESLTVSWSCSKSPNSQTFEGEPIDASLRSYLYTTDLTDSKTFTLTATTIGGTTVTKTVSLNFVNGIYYGASSISGTYDSTLINSLTKVLSENKNKSYTVNSTLNTYIYFCYPKRLGLVNSFSVGGFSGGFDLITTISFNNASNFSEDYYIYRSTNSSLGNTTITIS